VHLFGALFGLAVSKILNLKSVNSYKQSSVYHSDLFALIGTLFLWAFYPSFNGLLAKNLSDNGHTKAVVNTVVAISASCVVTFGVSTLVGKGKINVVS
jgi:ammonium transporter Rh